MPAEPLGEAGTDSHSSNGEATVGGVYDHWLGGKDNLAADRRVGDEVASLLPGIVATVRANRRFLVRAVRHLAGRGIRQFLDIGTGYPTSPNVHEVARRVRPDARVVYVDRDPAVAAHGRALLAADERTVMVAGDARDPLGIVADPQVGRLLDWSEPVGVLLVALLHFLTEDDDPAGSVAAFRDLMVPGSAVVISHATPGPPDRAAAMQAAVTAYQQLTAPIVPRTPEAVAGFFDGFELMAPGLVRVDRWQVRRERDWWPGAHWSRPTAAVPGDQITGVAGVGWLRGGR